MARMTFRKIIKDHHEVCPALLDHDVVHTSDSANIDRQAPIGGHFEAKFL